LTGQSIKSVLGTRVWRWYEIILRTSLGQKVEGSVFWDLEGAEANEKRDIFLCSMEDLILSESTTNLPAVRDRKLRGKDKE
jgi:hypothetical protein